MSQSSSPYSVRIEALYRAIYGSNGDPGLLTRVTQLETRVSEIVPVVKEVRDEVLKRGTWYYLILQTLPGVLTGLILWLLFGVK
jgi:hypothetical protein